MIEKRIQWVSVYDRVPDTTRIVLVAYGGGTIVAVGRMRLHDRVWFLVYGGDSVEVTHWAELPEPPEDAEP